MKTFINLLPPEERRQIFLERVNRRVVRFGIYLVFSLLVMMVILFIFQRFLSQKVQFASQQVAFERRELTNIQQTSEQKKAESLNLALKNFQSLANQDLKFSSYLIEFAKLLPPDVTIDTFSLDRVTKKVAVSGRAGTRESVLQLRQNILGSKLFENINFPLDNLQSPRDASWNYRFYIQTAPQK